VDDSSPGLWAEEIAGCASGLAQGDPCALERLFDRAAPRMLRYGLTLVRRREDAEDAVQAALVRLAKNPQALAAVQWPWAYLLRMVRNEALRILARRRPVLALWDDLAGRVSGPNAVELAERDAEVQGALRRLPADQAEVVVLKIWEGMTFQEIADVTGESLNTVASRYRYALTKLQSSLRRVAIEVGYVVE
jgi:RNA polymerase sigma-70 factor (ECF subfamily)